MEPSAVPAMRRIWSNPLPFPAQVVAIAPSGQRVAAATVHIDSDTAGSLTLYNADGRVIRHTADSWVVWSVAFSPDSQSMVTAEFSRSAGQEQWRARVLAVESGEERCRYLGELHPSRVVEFGPDGTWVLATGDAPPSHPGLHRGRAWAFDARTGRERWAHVLHSGAAACSPDAQSVAVANLDGVTIVDAATGFERTTLTTSSSVGAIAYSPDGRRLVIGGGANRVHAFDLASGSEIWSNQLFPSQFGLVRVVACTGDGQWVAALVGSGVAVLGLDRGALKYPVVGIRGGTRVLYSPTLRSINVTATNGDPEEEPVTSALITIDAHRGGVVSQVDFAGGLTSAVAADGRTLVTGGESGTGGFVEMYDAGVEISRHQGSFALSSIEMSTTAQPVVVVADTSAAVTVLAAATGTELKRQPIPGTVAAVVLADDDQAVAVGGSAGVRLFSILGSRFWKLESIGGVNGLAMATGAWIATAAGKTVRLLASVDGQSRWPAPNTHPQTVSRIACSSDGRWIGTGCVDRRTRILDASTGTETFNAAAEGKVRALAFQQATGALLASGNDDGTVLLIDAETLTQRRVTHGFGCSQLAFSADGTLLVVSWDDKTVAVYDLTAAGDPPKLQEFRCTTPISVLAFHPSDNSVAVAAETTHVALHDPHTGTELARYLHPGTVRDFAFSANGTMLATTADDGSVRVWSSPPLIDPQ